MPISTIALHRLYNQCISHHPFQNPAEVVTWLGAMQGQDYPGAKWSVGLRLPGSTDAQIEKAIADKAIIRTWIMRGTLHFVAPVDVRWMVKLVAQRVIAGAAARYRELEIDDEVVSHSNTVLVNALQGGKHLTRAELFAILESNGIATQTQRGIHLLQRASYAGLLCQGIMERNNPTFMLLEEALPPVPSLSHNEAVAELAKRYFISRGPTTLQNFADWSGLLMTDARAGLEAVKPFLISETIDGQTYWMPPSMPTLPAHPVFLLPGFDEYVLGYRDRSAVLEPQYAQRVCPGGNGVFQPTIVSDGRIVGIWKRTVKKGAVSFTPMPFTSLTDAEMQAFAAAAQSFAAFLGMSAVL
ncbi:MAG: winged helix DNA-binding domain-containing protein [Anaerolineae bacterium]|nr:winged helix DNA-binding domain-containing protein [Anaerolineae bacterium]